MTDLASLYGLIPGTTTFNAALYAVWDEAKHLRGHVSAVPEAWELYGLPADEQQYGLVSAAHMWCNVGEFCRNPLHPGPCKGWKHMLHSVAPGAYHAYEQQRVKLLNEKRKKRIAELEAAGHKVPAYLKKEVTYAQVPKKPEGVSFVAPTAKESEAALPPTAKEIAAKLDLKHAAQKAAKLEDQKTAILNMMHAHLGGIMSSTAQKKVKDKIQKAADELKPGEKLSDHPAVESTLKIIAKNVAKQADLTDAQHADLLGNLKQHVDAGVPEVPLLLQSGLKQAQDKAAAAKTAKLKKPQSDALLGMVNAYRDAIGAKPAGPGMAAVLANHIAEAHKLGNGKTPAEHKYVDGLLDSIASKIGTEIGLSYSDRSLLKKEMAGHLNEGGIGIPHFLGKHLAAFKTKKDAQKAAGVEANKGKVSGPLAHPDVMSAYDKIAYGGAGTDEKLALLDKATVTPGEVAKLSPNGQAKIHGFLDGVVTYDKDPANVALAKKLQGKLKSPNVEEKVAPGPLGAPAPATTHVPLVAHVGTAAMYATGEKPGTSKAKVAAYGKLTKAEFEGMSPQAKQGIEKDLHEAYGKFLDPSKKADVQQVAQKLGIPDPGTAGVGQAGAGGTITGKVGAKEITAAQEAALALAKPGQSMTQTTKNIMEKSWTVHLGNGSSDIQAKDLGDAIGSSWATEHVNHLPLSDAQKADLKAKAAAEATHMLTHGETEPPAGGVLAFTKKTGKIGPGTPDLAQEMYAVHLLKAGGISAKPVVNPPQAGAGGHNLPTPEGFKKSWGAVKELTGASPDISTPLSTVSKYMETPDEYKKFTDILVDGLANAWMTDAGLSLESGEHGLTSAERALIKNQVKAEIRQMLDAGAVEPPPGGVMHVRETLKDVAAKHGTTLSPATSGKAYLAVAKDPSKIGKPVPASALAQEAQKIMDESGVSLTDKLSKLTKKQFETLPEAKQKIIGEQLKMLHEDVTGADKKDQISAIHGKLFGSALSAPSKATSSTPASSSGPAPIASIAHIPQAKREAILAAFKLHAYGAQLKDPPEAQYDLLLAVAKHFQKDKEIPGSLTLRQVMQVVDHEHAKNLGVSNSGLLEAKISDWLKTPTGAAYAKVNTKPKPELIAAFSTKSSTGAKVPKGFLVQQTGGPGPWTVVGKKPSSDFHGYTDSEALHERNLYQHNTGQKWTAAQRTALTAYTSSSGSINNYLRGKTGQDPVTKKTVTEIQSAMLPLQRDHKLVRGMDWAGDLAAFSHNPEGAVGKVISDPAFLSTAVAGSGSGFGGAVRLEIEAPAGTMAAYLSDLSHFEHEHEMLLAAGTQMKIIKVTKSGGQTTFTARVVGAKTKANKA